MDEKQRELMQKLISSVGTTGLSALEAMAMVTFLADAICRAIPAAQPALEMHLANTLKLISEQEPERKPFVDAAEKMLSAVRIAGESMRR